MANDFGGNVLPRVFFDPSFFWICEDNASEETILAVLRPIVDWLQSPPVDGLGGLVSQLATDRLFELGKIPFEPRLTALLGAANLESVITASDLASLLNRLLLSAADVSDLGGLADCLIDDFALTPDIFQQISDPDVAGISRDAFWLFVVNQSAGNRIAFYELPSAGGRVTIQTEAAVLEVMPPDALASTPMDIEGSVKVIREPTDYFHAVDPLPIWKEPENLDEVALAIRAQAARLLTTGTVMRKFTLGKEFDTSVAENQGRSDTFGGVFLLKCGEVVAQFPGLDVAPFRTAESVHSEVRKRPRDSALARRVHVTTGNPAYRLLFWELTDGSIELANFGPKKELYIAT